MSDIGSKWDEYYEIAKQSGFNDEQAAVYADRQIEILEGRDNE